MAKDTQQPVFSFLGHHIQSVTYQRIGIEEPIEIRLLLLSKDFEEQSSIYSIVMGLEIDFETSKQNKIEILGGFQINDVSIIKNEQILGVFAASLYPYIRTFLFNLTFDDREPIKLPTLDMRYIDIKNGIVISKTSR